MTAKSCDNNKTLQCFTLDPSRLQRTSKFGVSCPANSNLRNCRPITRNTASDTGVAADGVEMSAIVGKYNTMV